MSDLENLCDALNAINGDILQTSHELHSKAQAYNRASAQAAAAARSAEGEAAAALARAAAALAAASQHCGRAAQSLVGASSEGQAFVRRTVGVSTSGNAVTASTSAKRSPSSRLRDRLLGGGTQLARYPQIAKVASAALSDARDSLTRWGPEDRARVQRWFGDDSESNRARLHSMVLAMERDLSDVTLHPFEDGEGGPDVYAYVRRADSKRRIFVGDTFWSTGSSPPDAQAGVILHELSHFVDIGGTDDRILDGKAMYGTENASQLASLDPTAAIDNADNIEYYLEDFML